MPSPDRNFANSAIFTQTASGTIPNAGNNSLYFKSDNNIYSKNSSGTEILVSAGAIPPTDIQIFSTVGSFTWTKPDNAKSVNIQLFGAGGGGGGSISVTSSALSSGNGGRSNILGFAGGTGGANTGVAGTAGTTNTSASTGLFAVGSGGGGGGGGLAVSGGAGGNGGFPAGGAGGGGATETGAISGAGGVGGDGLAIITTYF